MSDMPVWPAKPEKAHDEKTALARAAGYQFRRANAAVARLRIASEALSASSDQCVECNGQGQFRSPVSGFLDDCMACETARTALVAIGEIPD